MERLMVAKLVSVPPSQRSVTIELAAFLGGVLDGLLGLLLGADEQHFAAFAHGRREEIAGGFQLVERLAQVNDVNAVAGVEDEGLHLGVPAFGLVSKMDAGIQQFLNSNTNHKFPLVKSPPLWANHPAEHGIDFSVVVAPCAHRHRHLRPLNPPGRPAQFPAGSLPERAVQNSRGWGHGNSFLLLLFAGSLPLSVVGQPDSASVPAIAARNNIHPPSAAARSV